MSFGICFTPETPLIYGSMYKGTPLNQSPVMDPAGSAKNFKNTVMQCTVCMVWCTAYPVPTYRIRCKKTPDCQNHSHFCSLIRFAPALSSGHGRSAWACLTCSTVRVMYMYYVTTGTVEMIFLYMYDGQVQWMHTLYNIMNNYYVQWYHAWSSK